MTIDLNKELTRNPLFNPDGDTEIVDRRMIGGNTTNLNDFNNMRYPWVSDWRSEEHTSELQSRI